jgi:hypothetical protein
MPDSEFEAAIEASQGASQLSEGHAVAVAIDESLHHAAAGLSRVAKSQTSTEAASKANAFLESLVLDQKLIVLQRTLSSQL